jgi:hypothetical protein
MMELKKSMETEGSRCLGQDLNRIPPEYKSNINLNFRWHREVWNLDINISEELAAYIIRTERQTFRAKRQGL